MVMEADLFVQTSSTATSTGNTTTESVVHLPRVPSSPVITSSGGATASATPTATVIVSSKEAEAIAAAGDNLILEDEDAFLHPGSSSASTRNRTMMSSSYYRQQPSRHRERSMSSISSPNSHFPGASSHSHHQPHQPSSSLSSTAVAGRGHHQRSSSAILDLDYAGIEAATSKRRSLSTAAADGSSSSSFRTNPTAFSGSSLTSPSSSIPPPSSDVEATVTAGNAVGAPQTVATAVAPSPTAIVVPGEKLTGSKLPVSKSRAVPSSTTGIVTGSHVRFTEAEKPYKCPHLLSSDENDPSHRWPVASTSHGGGQAVQRTNSNPEMELCPVCMARKECEILLKRTWSKVNELLMSIRYVLPKIKSTTKLLK